MKFTRRKLAHAIVGSAAIATAQTQPPPATPDDELKAARDRVQANVAAVGRQDVPMSLEPAFTFKA